MIETGAVERFAPGGAVNETIRKQPEFRMSITLEVVNSDALWTAAAALIAAGGAGADDVAATIGPREDPDAAACIAALAGARLVSALIAGVEVDDFWIDRLPALPPRDLVEREDEREQQARLAQQPEPEPELGREPEWERMRDRAACQIDQGTNVRRLRIPPAPRRPETFLTLD